MRFPFTRGHLLSIVGIIVSIVGIIVGLLSISPAQIVAFEDFFRDHSFLFAWLISGLIGLVSGFVIGGLIFANRHSRIAYPNRQSLDYSRLLAAHLKAATTIDALGIANNQLTCDVNVGFYRELILQRSGKIRLLFLDPESEEIRNREVLEQRSPKSLSGLVQHNIEDVRRFCRELGLAKEFIEQHVQIRTLSYFCNLNAIIIDNKEAFIHYYGHDRRGFDCPAFYISSTNKMEVKSFAEDFETTWADGKALTI